MCNRRWDSLVDLAVMLHEEKVVLNDLVRQVQKKKTGHHQEIGGSVCTIKKRSRNDDFVRQIQKKESENGGHHQEIGGSVCTIKKRSRNNDLFRQIQKIESENGGHHQEIGGSVCTTKKRSRNDDLVQQIQKKESENGGRHQEIGGSVSTTKKRSRNRGTTSVSEKRRKIMHLHHHLLVDAADETGTWRKPSINKLTVKKKSVKVLDGGRIRIRGSFVCNSKQRPIVLSEEVKKVIGDCGGSEESAMLVIDKSLSRSDVNSGQCRLSIPHGQISKQFLAKLYPSEAARLESVSDGGIQVSVFVIVGGAGNEHVVRLKNWETNNMYVLVEGWKDLYLRNSLKQGQPLELWSFRRNLDLCLALHFT